MAGRSLAAATTTTFEHPATRGAWRGRSRTISLYPPTILLIDADEARALPAELLLRNAGARVHFTSIASVSPNLAVRPDVVVMPLTSPGDGALVLAAYLRTLPATRRTPIVFLNRGATETAREAAFQYGPVIEEPLDRDAFLALLRELVDEEIARRSGPLFSINGPKLLVA